MTRNRMQTWMIKKGVLAVLLCAASSLAAREPALPEAPQAEPVVILQAGKTTTVAEPFRVAGSGSAAPQATKVSFLWTKAALTVVFDCADTTVTAAQQGRDNVKLWKDDAVYVWLDVPHTHKAGTSQVMIQATPAGAVLDHRAADITFNIEGLEVKAARSEKGWTAALTIPFKGLGVDVPRPGTVWGFNVTRMDQPGQAVFSTLSSLPDSDGNRFDQWGHLVFTGSGSEAEIQAGKQAVARAHESRVDVLGSEYYRALLQEKERKAMLEARKGLPANPNASEDVHKLLQWFTHLPERETNRFLLANDIWSYVPDPGSLDAGFDRFVKSIHDRTGRWLPMIHVSYNDPVIPHPVHPFSVKDANRHAIAYWKAGGLVTIHINPVNPWTNKDGLEQREKIAEVLKPGTAANAAWMKKLDAYAALLAELRDAGVVVLWRPLHEMTFLNCYWYDCGATQDREVFKDIWRHMFRYFTYEKKLDNLIWVFGAADVGSWNGPEPLSVYPGDDYVDMVGLSLYNASVKICPRDYEQLTSVGKPFAFTEFGPGGKEEPAFDNMDLIRAVHDKYPQAVYAAYWHSWSGVRTAIADCRNVEQVMADPWVIDRDELDWRKTAVDLAKSRGRHVKHKEFDYGVRK